MASNAPFDLDDSGSGAQGGIFKLSRRSTGIVSFLALVIVCGVAAGMAGSISLKDARMQVIGIVLLTPIVLIIQGAGNSQEANDATTPAQGTQIEIMNTLVFLVVAYSVSGRFIHIATSIEFLFLLLSQLNVFVGAFFVLSGYIAAHAATALGDTATSLDDTVGFMVSRIMTFFPMHLLVLALFSPMFFWIDAVYNSPVVAAWDGIISATLTQAWFPLSAEEWNGPTWVLSALMFCYLPFPYALKVLNRQTKSQLRKTLWILTILSLLPKLGYTYDLEVWSVREEAWNMNYTLFNCLQFSPLSAFLEVLMGATAYRLVTLDTETQTAATGSSLLPLMALIVVLVLRALKLMTINDLLVRAGIFLPLFIAFVMRLHRESLGSQTRCPNKVVTATLNLGFLKWLGDLSIPVLVVHGPVGQLLFAPLVARKIWGRNLARIPGFFVVYWLVVVALAFLVNKYFAKSEKVGELTEKVSEKVRNMIRN